MEMNTIHKYTIPIQGRSIVSMPMGANIIECSEQNGFACIWAIINTSSDMHDVAFQLFKTGQEIEDLHTLQYIGCAKMFVGQELCLYIFKEI